MTTDKVRNLTDEDEEPREHVWRKGSEPKRFVVPIEPEWQCWQCGYDGDCLVDDRGKVFCLRCGVHTPELEGTEA